MNSERARTLASLAALSFLAGCADLSRGEPLPDSGSTSAQDGAGPEVADGAAPLSFARDVHHLVIDGCHRCHSSGGSASTTAFVLVDDEAKDRQQVLLFVNPDNPPGSRFLAKGAGSGHGGGAIYALGTPEYRTILSWILQGSFP